MRILVFDDNPDDRFLVARELRREFGAVGLEEVVDQAGFERIIEGPAPEAVVTECKLSWTTGIKLSEAVRQQWPGVPVIMFTSSGSEDAAVAAIKAGLDDYVPKTRKHLVQFRAAVRDSIKRAKNREVAPAASHYRRIFESSPAALYVSTGDGVLIDTNPAMVEMLGFPNRDTLLATNMSGIYSDSEARVQWLELVLEAGVVHGYEARLRRWDDTFIWVRDTARASHGSNQQVLLEGSIEDITRRKKLEAAVSQSERRFRAVAEANLAGVFIISGTTFSYANPALACSLGYEVSDLVGCLGLADLAIGENRDRLEELLRAGEQDAGKVPLALECRRRDGTTADFEVLASQVTLAGLPAIIGTMLDVGERKLAEAALRESRRTLVTLMSNLPGMAYRCHNFKGRRLEFVSEGVTELTGHEPAEYVGDGELVYGDLIHPEDRVSVWEQIQEAVAAAQPFKLQYRIQLAGDEVKWVWEQGRGVFSEDGNARFLEGFVTDISDRLAAERAVKASEIWYRSLFESANDAILLMDGDRFVDCNSRTLEMFCCTPDRIVGREPHEFSPQVQPDGSESRQLVAEKIGAALHGEPVFYEWQHCRADGEPFDTEVSLNRVDVGGRIFIQTIVREITDRKQAEAALQRRDAILETVSFATARFLQSPTAGAVNEVLGRFGSAADVSRVYLFENVLDQEGDLITRQQYEWVAPGIKSEMGNHALQSLFPGKGELAMLGAAISGGAVIHGHVRDFPLAEQRFLRNQGILSIAVVPVFEGGELWGFLGVDECRKERCWTPGEIRALRATGDILAAEVHLMRTRRDLTARTAELELLNRVNELLASTLDAITVMQEIADIVCLKCVVNHVSLALLEGQGLRFVAWSGYDAPQRGQGLTLSGPGIMAEAARRRQAIYMPNVAGYSGYVCGDQRVSSEYAVPLIFGNQILGVLNCESFVADGINEWQRAVIDRLAGQAAIAVHNAEIYHRMEGTAK